MWKILKLFLILFLGIDCSLLNEQNNDSSIKEASLLLSAGLSENVSGESAGGGTATAEGTHIVSKDGKFSIDIPKDALSETVEFSITKYSAPTNALPGNYIPTADIYQITPSYRFQKEVTIEIVSNPSAIQAYNLEKSKSIAFSISSTNPEEGVNRFPSWSAHPTRIDGDKLVFTTKTFSIFGIGTPPPGNHAPVIYGAYYYFKAGCSYLPYQLRTEVVDPDGDAISVFLITGPANGGANSIQMTREGSTNWYNANIPYEAMSQTGIKMQVIAVDIHGLNSTVPNSNVFTYPADSGDTVYINNYKRDADNDGILCAWERDNGRSDTNPGDVAGVADTDGDGIPNSSDHTPNGESNPAIDHLAIYPSLTTMDVTEKVSFGVSASFGGSFRYVNASYNTTGNALNGSPVGSLSGGVFTANHPGLAGVVATVGAMNTTATVRVNDSVGPNNITDLIAISLSSTQIRLQWTAPGDDGIYGKASSYQIYRSTTLINNNASCNGSLVFHGLTPKNAGLPEKLDINGLTPNTTYYFCIRAFDDSGNLNTWNGTVSAATQPVPDIVPPANLFFTNLSATTISHHQIRLNWLAVGDDGNTGSASAYEIRRSTSPINNDAQCDSAVNVINSISAVPAGTPLSFVVGGLSDSTIHYFCIRAYDEVNNRNNWNGILSAATARANGAPIVSMGVGLNPIVDTGTSGFIDARPSTDPDASICLANAANYQYIWTLINKPIGSAKTTADITDANTKLAQFIPDVPGIYTFQFTFVDDPGSCLDTAKFTTGTISFTARSPIHGHGLVPLNLSGQVSTFAGGAPGYVDGIGNVARFGGTLSLATNGKDLFIGDTTSVRVANIFTRAVTTVAGAYGIISYDPPVDGPGSSARFQFITSIFSDSNYIYLTDGHRIRKMNIGTWEVSTLAGSGVLKFSFDPNDTGGGYVNGIGTAAKFNNPSGIAKIGGYLYVADNGNAVVRKIALATGEVTTLAGSGSKTFADGIGSSASFANVTRIVSDGTYLYVTDSNTIRKIDPVTTQVTTIAGAYLQSGHVDGVGTAARLKAPTGLTTDGRFLYFMDFGTTLRILLLATNEIATPLQVSTMAGNQNNFSIVDGTGSNARFGGGYSLTNDGKSLFIGDFLSDQNYSIRKVD
ncbi:hypothetical protein EHQ24_11970 [Leptospira noumeaensis]|uniref:Fibronectin type-III domain-containing protein n=1 Tax=Leptospira noumeaensis TaxID=2484964 RepID=A0A4R9I788_9LEPT|nr:fibronectin type III domain-containing protein [Leptospira noumeaensis]TGK81988.1 hypothetical protein EHQ24_11970 [Leptospira noumeaensis]